MNKIIALLVVFCFVTTAEAAGLSWQQQVDRQDYQRQQQQNYERMMRQQNAYQQQMLQMQQQQMEMQRQMQQQYMRQQPGEWGVSTPSFRVYGY